MNEILNKTFSNEKNIFFQLNEEYEELIKKYNYTIIMILNESKNGKNEIIKLKEIINKKIYEIEKKIKIELKKEIEQNKNKLEKIGIEELNGKWYFTNFLNILKCPIIFGKKLNSITNIFFNKRNNIGNKKGKISNVEYLIQLFKEIGLIVATNEEEINKFKNIVLNNKKELEKKGIYQKEGKWYFTKRLNPNLINIGNLKFKKNSFEKILKTLGFTIATNDEIIEFIKNKDKIC